MSTLSGLIAQALERARLFDAEHARSQELQRALLPRQLPELPAVTAAAKYLPAGRGMDVGGDWYDVIPLSADRVALVIGDVMGHGLPEAVIMGRVRTALCDRWGTRNVTTGKVIWTEQSLPARLRLP